MDNNRQVKKSDGAFWAKTSQNGKEYYSGHIFVEGKKLYLVMFPNDRKKTEKSPVFDIKISERQGEGS